MFEIEKNKTNHDPLRAQFEGMNRQLRASAELKRALKTGEPLRTPAVGKRVHVRRFARAIAVYAVCAVILLGAALMLPSLLKGNEPTPANPVTTTEPDVSPMPDNFSFSITFNVYGISSYDSATGRLVRTNDPVNPNLEQYETTLKLSDEQMKEIYGLLMELDFWSYPTNYSPTDMMSKPCDKWVLNVQMANITHMVVCHPVPAGRFEGRDEKAQAFIDTFKRICEIITSTEEWKALPEPEIKYS